MTYIGKDKLNKYIMIMILTILLVTITCCSLTTTVRKNENVVNDYNKLLAVEILKNNTYELISSNEFAAEYEQEEAEEKDELVYLGKFKLTAYCDCKKCQGEWVGTTALGIPPTPMNTIAVDTNIIPLGSIIRIDGFENQFRAEDTGSAINEYKIDIFVDSHEECYKDIYNRYTDVYLVYGG